MKKLVCENPINTMIALFLLSRVGLSFDIGENMWGQIPNRLVLGIIMIGTMYIVIGRDIFLWTNKSFRYALSKSIYFLIMPCVLLVALIFIKINSGDLNNNYLCEVISCLLLGLSVGIYEEGLYRGIIANGFIKILPNTSLGLLGAVLISGFIFGFVHITGYIAYIVINPISIIVQMVVKIFNSGAFGMLMEAIYLKTKNIWVCIVVHALKDFFVFFLTILLGLESTDIQYVDVTTSMNIETFLHELFLVLLLGIPSLVTALMILKKLKPSECIFWK